MDSRELARLIVGRAHRWRAGSVQTVIDQYLGSPEGRAAFAVANGFVLPEERTALLEALAASEAEVATFKAYLQTEREQYRDSLNAAVEAWRKRVEAWRTRTEAAESALLDLAARCDGDEGVRADGSNVQTMAAHAVIDADDPEDSGEPYSRKCEGCGAEFLSSDREDETCGACA